VRRARLGTKNEVF